MMVTYRKYSGDDVVFTQTNRYNPDGQRIKKKTNINNNLTETDYFYDRGNVLYTKDGTDMNSQNILNAEGNVIYSSRATNSGYEYYNFSKDVRNSTSVVTDKSNNAKAVYTYSDYGATEAQGDSSFSNEVCYTGGIFDSETGEYYLNARYYDPDISRFTTMDTYRGEFEESLSLNLYTYCDNNSINYIDPTGHKKELPRWVKKYLKCIPNKKKHYKRNNKNTKLPKNEKKAKKAKYKRMKWPKDACHQFSRKHGEGRHKKYVSKDGHKEVIFNHKGNSIITDARDIGTYNFYPSGLKHVAGDVYPWVKWGNSAIDSTMQFQRVDAFLLTVPSKLCKALLFALIAM